MKRTCAAVLVVILAVALSATTGQAQIPLFFNGQGYVDTIGNDFFLTLTEIRGGTGPDAIEAWITWKLNLTDASWEIVTGGLTSNIPTLGERRANGVYLYNAQKGILVMDITFSNFLGCGIERGMEALDISGITATVLTFTIMDPVDSEGVPPITCTRPSGTAGDILGVWQCGLGPLGTLTVDVRADKTIHFTGNMQNCLID